MFLHNFTLEIELSIIEEQSVKTTLYTLLIILQGEGVPTPLQNNQKRV